MTAINPGPGMPAFYPPEYPPELYPPESVNLHKRAKTGGRPPGILVGLVVVTTILGRPVLPSASAQNPVLDSPPATAAQPTRPGTGRMTGEMAYEVLNRVCQLGPRICGSVAMIEQQQMLTDHFQKLGASVTRQTFSVRHPVNGTPVELCNLIVQFHPQRMNRILIACHYDTRPFPDRDSENPTGLFLGANDGASGVGLLCELGTFMPGLESEFGVDFVFFDGEEFIFQQGRDPYLLGSTWFARSYAARPPAWRYSAGVLVDMIGDKDLNLYYEKNSWRDARDITRQIWDVARREGVEEFVPRTRHEVRDDHLPLIQIAGIPTCDIIDFDFPSPSSTPKNKYWHTTQDTPDKCSAESLAKVGNVILAWLREVRVQR